MQALRRATFLARFVLAWFALAVGVAVAAPLVKPQAMELVCSAGGALKLLAVGGGDDAAAPSASLDCPWCLALDAPPPPAAAQAHLAAPAFIAPRNTPAAHAAGGAAPPLPARGPPLPALA